MLMDGSVEGRVVVHKQEQIFAILEKKKSQK